MFPFLSWLPQILITNLVCASDKVARFQVEREGFIICGHTIDKSFVPHLAISEQMFLLLHSGHQTF